MNHASISTELTKPDLSERLSTLDEFEPAIDVDLLLDSLTNQFAEPEEEIFNVQSLNIAGGAPSASMIQTEECVDLNPLLFANSDELFINDVGKIESTCDPAEKANYILLNKVDRYDDPILNKNANNVIYTPEIISAAQSPLTMDTMDDEFFTQRPFSAEDSAQMLDFTFSNSDFVIDCNNLLNSAVCNNMTIQHTIHDENVKKEVIYDTPENSSSPSGFGTNTKKIFELPRVDLSKIQIFKEEIQTPDIINSIIEYEEIDTIKRDDPKKVVTLTNFLAEDLPSTSTTFFEPDITYVGNSPASGVSSPASVKKPAKRCYVDDSDDEYVDDDNDRDYVPYEEPKRGYLKLAKRGRPPKRVKSISSDDYSQLDPDEAKYREMRDRNNEASRRSRYKRKQKEMKCVDELTIEEERNVKLKAEVEELQKSVDRFRDTLMKVMMCK